MSVTSPPTVVAQALRGHRREAGLTQQQLADLSTVSVRAVRDIESGVTLTPRSATLLLLAEALRLDEGRRADLLAHGDHGGPGSTYRPQRPRLVLGRAAELEAIGRWLDGGQGSVLALVGFPGAGKSALAHAAQDAAQAAGWATAWSAADQGFHTSHRRALSLLAPATRDLLARGEDLSPALAAIARVLGPLRTWWVVDGAVGGPSAERLTALRRRCPALRFAYTADHPLGIPGEKVLTVEPLASRVGDGETSPALDLLGASAIPSLWDEEDRDAAHDLCELVDGLPAVLTLLSREVALHGPRLVREGLLMDRLGYVASLAPASGHHGPALAGRVRRTVGALGREAQNLLQVLVSWGPRPVTAGTLAEPAGQHLWTCMRSLNELHETGLVRRDAGRTFRLLHHVRDLHLSSTLPASPPPRTPSSAPRSDR